MARSSPTGGLTRNAAPSVSVEAQRALQRSLGPTAWAVLADVALDVVPDGAGTAVVEISARRLAAQFGITKDTAARALRRLQTAGILLRRPQRTGPAGRFTPGTYEVRLPWAARGSPCRLDGDTVGHQHRGSADSPDADGTVSAASTNRPARYRPRFPTARGAAQLSLLDDLPNRGGPRDSEPSP